MVESKYYLDKMINTMFEGYALVQTIESSDNEAYNGIIIEINYAFEEMLKTSCNEVVGKTIKEVMPKLSERLSDLYKNKTEEDELIQFELYLEKLDRQFLVRVINITCDKIILLFIEITLQNKARDTFRLHEILFENAADIMLYITLEGKIVNANKRACEKYCYTKEQLLTMTIHEIRHPSTVDEYEQQMKMADGKGITFECIHVRSNGSTFPVEVSAKSTYTRNGRFRVHIIRDITKRKENEEKISWLARYDTLTEISNRANFIMHLEEEIKRSTRNKTLFAVMLFDIDKFKYINDHYGHEAGDIVLRHVAQEAKKVIRAGDQIGRFGGDEFVVLQTGVKECSDIEALARRIQESVNEAITYESIPISVKISIGISLFPKDAIDADNLLHSADKAMYKIKQNGGGGFSFFTPCNLI